MDKKTTRALLALIVKLGIVAAILAALLIFVFDIAPVHGNYMYPALRDGDLCITYKLAPLRLNDVVMYEQDGTTRFGRVVGLPGDEIVIDEEVFKINDLVPSESIFYPTTSETGVRAEVGEGEVFLLNDFRSDDDDSRGYGCISQDELRGTVSFVFRRRGF